jgi:SnoaL-like domain
MSAADAEAQLGILSTMGRYIYAVDHGNTDKILELFTHDGVLHPHGLSECRGRAAIAAFIEASRESRSVGPDVGRVRHHVSSVHIELDDREHARAWSYFLALNATGPDHWGVYRDRLTRVDEQWLFQHRSVAIEGATPDGWIGSGTGPVKFEPVLRRDQDAG